MFFLVFILGRICHSGCINLHCICIGDDKFEIIQYSWQESRIELPAPMGIELWCEKFLLLKHNEFITTDHENLRIIKSENNLKATSLLHSGALNAPSRYILIQNCWRKRFRFPLFQLIMIIRRMKYIRVIKLKCAEVHDDTLLIYSFREQHHHCRLSQCSISSHV